MRSRVCSIFHFLIFTSTLCVLLAVGENVSKVSALPDGNPYLAEGNWFVSSSGASTNSGKFDNPWDLQTALNHPSSVKPGHTIWIRGGNYHGPFTSQLTGTKDQPIVVRNYNDERVVIDDANVTSVDYDHIIQVLGGYCWYWGFEITSTRTNRVLLDQPTQGVPGTGINFFGNKKGNKAINLIIYNVGQPGIGFWAQEDGGEIYGCLMWGNGIYDQNGARHRGSAIYAQNQFGHIYIRNVISFRNFVGGMKAYGEEGYTDNFHFIDNISFNNGQGLDIEVANINHPITFVEIKDNMMWEPQSSKGEGLMLGFLSKNNGTAVVSGNHIFGASYMYIKEFSDLTFQNNIVYKTNTPTIPLLSFVKDGGFPPFKYKVDNNTYFAKDWRPQDGRNLDLGYTPLGGVSVATNYNSVGKTFDQWKQETGYDLNSTFSYTPDAYSPSYPAPSFIDVSVKRNEYDPRITHVAIYNYKNVDTYEFDLSQAGIEIGDSYEIRDVQNYLANPVLSGVAEGTRKINVPLTLTDVSAIPGVTHFENKHTDKTFNSFIFFNKKKFIPSVSLPSTLQNGLLAHWKFDEGQGTKAFDEIAGRTAKFSGQPTWINGKLKGSLSFDGAHDFLSFDPLPLSGDFSFSLWVQSSDKAIHTFLGNNQNLGLVGFYNTGTFSGSGGAGPLWSNSRPSNNSWHHIVIVGNRTSQLEELFIDGISQGTMNIATLDLGNNPNNFLTFIGRDANLAYSFKGSLDDIRIYGRVISKEEIDALKNLPLDVTPPSLTVNYPSPNTVISGISQFIATPFDESGFVRLQYKLDGRDVGKPISNSPYMITWDSGFYTNGDHLLSVESVDLSGNKFTSTPIKITINNAHPHEPIPDGFFVHPEGHPRGTGSFYDPWDLQTALFQPDDVKPGDTLWLRGGTYVGSFLSKLNGTALQSIKVKQYPGERATIDGRGTSEHKLRVAGSYTWFQDFEIMNSDPVRFTPDPGSGTIMRGAAIYVLQNVGTLPGLKFINLVLHDTDGGFGVWNEAPDLEINGCLIYYNGWESIDRGHGHGIYVQNQTGYKLLKDNVIFKQFSHGIHAYTAGSSFLNNITMDGNVIFDNGLLSKISGAARNILYGNNRVGGDVDCVVTNNSTYFSSPGENNVGYHAGCTNVTVTGNHFIDKNGTALRLDNNLNNFVLSGNTFYGNTFQENAAETASISLDSTLYPGNTFLSEPPLKNEIILRQNAYDSNRTTIVVYNWLKTPTAELDLSKVLKTNDTYEIKDVQNYFGASLVSGTYHGEKISLPMNSTLVPPLVGDGIGYVPPAHTPLEFGAFILINTTGRGSGVNQVSIAATASPGGTISPIGIINLYPGANQTFTIVPNSGYRINNVTVDGVTQSISGSSFVFTNVASNRTINVDFLPIDSLPPDQLPPSQSAPSASKLDSLITVSNVISKDKKEAQYDFTLSASAHVTAQLFTGRGAPLLELKNEDVAAGQPNSIVWDGNLKNGEKASSGIYLIKVRLGDKEEMKKIVIIR